MIRRGLNASQHFTQGEAVFDSRYFNFDDLSAKFSKHLDTRLDRFAHIVVDIVEEMIARHAKAQSRHAAFDIGQVVAHRLTAGRRIVRIVTGDGLCEDGAVRYSAAQRPDMIETEREGHRAIAADAAIGRFHTDKAIAVCRNPDGTAGIGTGHGRARAAR